MEIIDRTNPSQHDLILTRRSLMREFFTSVLMGNGNRAIEIAKESYQRSVLSPNIEGSNSVGGYLVPEEFSTMVDTDLRRTSLAFSECTIISMQREVLNMSTLVGNPTVAWTDEDTAITASKGTFGRLTLTAKKLAAIIPASEELLADNNVDYPSLMMTVINDPFVQEIDAQVFNGVGTPFTGILNTAGVVTKYLADSSTGGKTKYIDITWDDLYRFVLNSLPTRNMRGAKLYLDQNVFSVLMRLKATGSGEYFQPNLGINTNPSPDDAYAAVGTFCGFPVILVTAGVLIAAFDSGVHASTPFCIFGNLKSTCYIGNRLALDVSISIDATVESVNAFVNDLRLWRFKKRLAFGVGIPGKLAVLSTDAS